jgi:hypothetical protein
MNMHSSVAKDMARMQQELIKLQHAVTKELAPPAVKRTVKDVVLSVTPDEDIIDVEIVED